MPDSHLFIVSKVVHEVLSPFAKLEVQNGILFDQMSVFKHLGQPEAIYKAKLLKLKALNRLDHLQQNLKRLKTFIEEFIVNRNYRSQQMIDYFDEHSVLAI